MLFVPIPARILTSATARRTDAPDYAEITIKFTGTHWHSLIGYEKLTGKLNVVDNINSEYLTYTLFGTIYKNDSALFVSIKWINAELNRWEFGTVYFDDNFSPIGVEAYSVTAILADAY
jgi:hypothetical protein